jgi:peptidoglycan/LPS O-acetylase OafA/YrhL
MILGSPLLPGEWGKAALVLMAYPIAACSYRFIERPFLRLKLYFKPKDTKLPPDRFDQSISRSRRTVGDAGFLVFSHKSQPVANGQ